MFYPRTNSEYFVNMLYSLILLLLSNTTIETISITGCFYVYVFLYVTIANGINLALFWEFSIHLYQNNYNFT